jgi:hypothetical protein
MTFGDRVLLFLHVALVIFTIGPVTAAIMVSPRLIKANEQATVRHQLRNTRIFTAGTLLMAIMGGVLAQVRHEWGKPWVIISLTLYIVGLILLVVILRELRLAVAGLDPQTRKPVKNAVAARARIASLSGVVGLIWLAILGLMVWQ